MASDINLDELIKILGSVNTIFTIKRDKLQSRKIPGEIGAGDVNILSAKGSKPVDEASKALVNLVKRIYDITKVLQYHKLCSNQGQPDTEETQRLENEILNLKESTRKKDIEIKSKDTENKTLQERLDNVNTTLKQKTTELGALKTQITELENKLRILEQDRSKQKNEGPSHPAPISEQQIQDISAENKQYKNEIERLRNQLSNLHNQLKNHSSKPPSARDTSHQLEQVTAENEQLTKTNKTLTDEVKLLKEQLKESKNTITLQLTEIEELKALKRETTTASPGDVKAEIQDKFEENQILTARINSLKDEIKSLEEGKQTLQSQINQLQKKNEEQSNKISTLEEENKKCREKKGNMDTEYKTAKEKMEKAMTDLQKKFDRSEKEKQEIENKYERTGKSTKIDLVSQITLAVGKDMSRDSVIQVLTEKNAENIDRLAAEMNAKVAADESSLENISIKCRPMNVAEDYNMLCSNAWLEAKTALDEAEVDEEKAVKFLCNLLVVATDVAGKAYTTLTASLQKALDTKKALPQSVITSIGDYLRATVGDFKYEPLVQAVIQQLEKTGENKSHTKHTDVKTFIRESAVLAWKMVIQRPPMSFDTPGLNQPFKDEDLADLFWGSNPNNEGAVLRYYVYPILKHGDKPMGKGKVIVK